MAYIGRQPSYGAFEKQSMTADSSTTTFSLNYTVGSSSSILVSVAGVIQEPETGYNLTGGGTSIVFSAAPTTGDTVFVIFLGIARDVGQFLNSGIITAQTATTDSASADLFLTYDDSASALRKITNTNLTKTLDITGQTELSTVAADDDLLLVYDTSASAIKKIQKSNVARTLVYLTRTATGDGSTVGFTVTSGVDVNNVMVLINGLVQTPTTDYSVSSTTLTFGTAPAASDAIVIREFPR
jgi:hypothetical protein